MVNVGDKVEVIKKSYSHCFAVGSVVEVLSVDWDEGDVYCRGVSEGFGHHCNQTLTLDSVKALKAPKGVQGE